MANKKIGNEDIFEGNILVDIIAKATELEAKLKDQLKTFKDLAKNNPFKNGEDLKKFNDTMKEIDASASLLEQTQKNNKKATEELNKELAKEVAASKEIKDIIDDVNGTLNQNIKLQTQRKTQIQDLRKDQAELNKLYKIGAISQSKFTIESAKLGKEIQELSIANSKLGFTIKAQIKEGQAASTSFDQQAQRLGQLRSAYRKLTEEERENAEIGGVLLKSITALDKQVKANDASIGNFQRNVGNYKDGLKGAIKETGLFNGVLGKLGELQGLFAVAQQATAAATGKSTGALKLFKIALASTGIGLLVVALGSMVTALTSSEEGTEKLNKGLKAIGVVVGNVIDVYSEAGKLLIDFYTNIGKIAVKAISGDFEGAMEVAQKVVDDFDTSALEDAVDDLINNTGKEIEQQNKLSDIRRENLKLERELVVSRAKGEKEIAELRLKARNFEKYTSEEREKFLQSAINKERELLELEVNLAERKNKIAQDELKFNQSSTDELDAAAEAEAKLYEVQTKRLTRSKELQSELNRARKEINKDLLSQRVDIEPINPKTFADLVEETAKANKEVNEQIAEDNEELLKDNIKRYKRDAKAFFALEKSKSKAAKEEEEEREKQRKEQLDVATNFTRSVAQDFQRLDKQRQDQLKEEADRTQENISTQQRLAEQGLDNQLAFEQQKAAQIELAQQEAAEKAERNQKRLLFFESVLQFLKEGSPLEAVGKAAALTVGAGMVAGQFYEGSDLIEKDLGKPHLKGKDGYLVRVDGKERVFSPSQNMKIRQALGNVTNEDLVEMVTRNDSPTLINNFNDKKIVQGLQSVEREIQNIKVELNIDEKGVISQSQFKDGLKRVQKQAKRPRGGINP